MKNISIFMNFFLRIKWYSIRKFDMLFIKKTDEMIAFWASNFQLYLFTRHRIMMNTTIVMVERDWKTNSNSESEREYRKCKHEKNDDRKIIIKYTIKWARDEELNK